MQKRHKLILFATIFAIFFTTLTFLFDKYSFLWLSLEVIILPIIYTIGYEILIDEQKEEFDDILDSISFNASLLEKENFKLKAENKYLKARNIPTINKNEK